MASRPTSAQPLPLGLPNISAPITEPRPMTRQEAAQSGPGNLSDTDRQGGNQQATGWAAIGVSAGGSGGGSGGAGYITQAWRYFFGTLASKDKGISVSWTQSVSATPTQAEVQAIVAQVSLLSKQLGGST